MSAGERPVPQHVLEGVRQLSSLADTPSATLDDAQPLLQALWREAPEAGIEADHLLSMVLPGVRGSNLEVAGLLSVAAGALVEAGADPAPGLPAVQAGLTACVTKSVLLLQRYREAVPTQGDDPPGEEAILPRMDPLEPELTRAWRALELFGRSGVAFLSRVPEARVAYRGQSGVLEQLGALAGSHEWAEWLRKLLLAPHRESLLVLHPTLRRGYRVEVSGVADNFQLHTLLAAALIGPAGDGWLPGQPPSPEAVAEARGEPTAGEVVAQGTFNLVNWFGLSGDGTLSDALSCTGAWIWNEGLPADIATFEDQRVILLTDPAYTRTWMAAPLFSALKPDVRVTEHLSEEQVQSWLARMAAQLPHHS